MDKGFWAYLRNKVKPKKLRPVITTDQTIERQSAQAREHNAQRFRNVLPMVVSKADRNTTLRLVQTSKQIGDDVAYTGAVSRHAFDAFITTLGDVVLLLDERDKLRVGYYQYWNNAVAQDNNNAASTNTRSNAWFDAMDINWKKLKPLLDKLLIQKEKIRSPQSNVLCEYGIALGIKTYKHIDLSGLGRDLYLQDLYDDNAFPDNARVIAFNDAMTRLQKGYKQYMQDRKRNTHSTTARSFNNSTNARSFNNSTNAKCSNSSTNAKSSNNARSSNNSTTARSFNNAKRFNNAKSSNNAKHLNNSNNANNCQTQNKPDNRAVNAYTTYHGPVGANTPRLTAERSKTGVGGATTTQKKNKTKTGIQNKAKGV